MAKSCEFRNLLLTLYQNIIVVKSPFANCEARIVQEQRTVKFRGDEYSYVYSCYECEQTKERFTTTEMDEENVQQVYRQYRTKYGIPSSEEIVELKDKYGISAARLALILGFGENQISNYIDGEVPNKANGKTLSAIKDPRVFMRYVELAKEQLKPSVYEKLMTSLQKMIHSYSYAEVNEHTTMVAEDTVEYRK